MFQLFLILLLIVSFALADMDVNIVGGVKVPTDNTDFKFMASLQYKSGKTFKHYCGGSLVDPWWVMTAAHCVRYSSPDRIRIGSLNTDDGGSLRTVTQRILHPKYVSIYYGDIALLKLNSPVTDITPVDLDMKGQYDKAGDIVTSIGWGYTQQYVGPVVKELRMVEIQVHDNNICKKQYQGEGDINDGNLCTWGKWDSNKNQRQDQCSGDSGGPTFYYDKENHKTVQVALTSWGKGCGQKNFPGVNTRISYYSDFIKSKIDNVPTPTPKPTINGDLLECYSDCSENTKKGKRRRKCKRQCRRKYKN